MEGLGGTGEFGRPWSGVELRWAKMATQSRPPARFLSTTIAMKAGHDSSSIDYVHPLTPTHNGTALPEITRVPLLPDTESPPPERKALDEEAIGRVIRPEISTVSGDGTHLDVPSAMSEVTDNHAAELDPYDLPSKVAAAASKRPNQATKKPEQPGSVKAVWNGLLDDIFGEKNPPKA